MNLKSVAEDVWVVHIIEREREKERERKRESERENIYGVFEESQLLKKKKFLKNDSSFEEFRQLRVECDAQKCSQGIFRPV